MLLNLSPSRPCMQASALIKVEEEEEEEEEGSLRRLLLHRLKHGDRSTAAQYILKQHQDLLLYIHRLILYHTHRPL